ncbi:MAG: hypothetical protein QGD94_00040 [Planctomycetia bacterium]|nr:hypothetical protein [Planctomycetia bacterium]
MKIEVFGKSECTKCKAVMIKVDHFLTRWGADKEVALSMIDVDSIEGRAEGAFNDVFDVPTTILWHDDGKEIARWDNTFIRSEDLKNYLGVQ